MLDIYLHVMDGLLNDMSNRGGTARIGSTDYITVL